MSEPFIGEIRPFGFSFTPRGWALCDGQLLPINQHQALFSILGTTYGGDGRTTFGLPDLRGRVAMHVADDRRLGTRGGAEAVTLQPEHMPHHTHGVSASTGLATSGAPEGAAPATTREATYAADGPTVAMAGTTPAGGGQAHDTMGPFLTISYCIALVGVFPSRN